MGKTPAVKLSESGPQEQVSMKQPPLLGMPDTNNAETGSSRQSRVRRPTRTIQYHCDNCQRDITHDVRVRCLTCTNFDLCVECWYSGVEIPPHTKSHECEVIETLDCCVFTEDWSAQEELMLLDAISSAGIGNWKEVAKQIETKTEEECKQHYLKVYFSSQYAPLPDPNKCVKPVPPVPSKTKREQKQPFDLSKVHKTKLSPKYELTTYNPYREEFDVEWEGGVEKELQDLHFSDEEREGGADTEGRQISLDALRAYQWVQNERTRRRGIIAAGDLFDYHAHEEHDARTLANCGPIGVDTRIYQQCMTRDQYAGFLKALEVERTLLQRINVLKKLRMSGKRFLPEGVPSLDATRPKKTKLGYEPRVQDYSLLSLLEQEFCRKFGVTPSQYLTFKELLMRESELYGGVSEQRAIKLLQKPLNEVRHYLSHFDRLGLISRRKIPLPETPPPPPPQLPPPPQTAAATAAAVAAGAVIPTAMSPMLGTSRMHKDSKRHHKHKLKKHHHHEHKHDKE